MYNLHILITNYQIWNITTYVNNIKIILILLILLSQTLSHLLVFFFINISISTTNGINIEIIYNFYYCKKAYKFEALILKSFLNFVNIENVQYSWLNLAMLTKS